MKNLDEWLSTKVVKPINNHFPKNLNKKDMLEFFDLRGFEESKYSEKLGTTSQNGHFYSKEDLFSEISESNKPLFCFSNTKKGDKWTFWVRFANPGIVSEDNPMYFCRYNLKDFINPKINEMVTVEKKYKTDCPYNSFEEFAEDMDNKF